jgi:Kef-type K+ transport system membrane component KefB
MEKIKVLFSLYVLFLLLSLEVGIGAYFILEDIGRYVLGICLIVSSLSIILMLLNEAKE